MLEMLKNYSGNIVVNGKKVGSITEDMLKDNTVITLTPIRATVEQKVDTKEYRIKVKTYMTQPSTPDFDFMDKFNKGVPMPLVHMIGTIEKETPGMYYMNLRADTDFNGAQLYCMRCGRPITNKVSQYFGIGPECGQHGYTNPFKSDEELTKAVDEYKKTILTNITWSGWVIKSSIVSMEEI